VPHGMVQGAAQGPFLACHSPDRENRRNGYRSGQRERGHDCHRSDGLPEPAGTIGPSLSKPREGVACPRSSGRAGRADTGTLNVPSPAAKCEWKSRSPCATFRIRRG